MTTLFALVFPIVTFSASVATIWALIKFVRDIRADFRREDAKRNVVQ